MLGERLPALGVPLGRAHARPAAVGEHGRAIARVGVASGLRALALGLAEPPEVEQREHATLADGGELAVPSQGFGAARRFAEGSQRRAVVAGLGGEERLVVGQLGPSVGVSLDVAADVGEQHARFAEPASHQDLGERQRERVVRATGDVPRRAVPLDRGGQPASCLVDLAAGQRCTSRDALGARTQLVGHRCERRFVRAHPSPPATVGVERVELGRRPAIDDAHRARAPVPRRHAHRFCALRDDERESRAPRSRRRFGRDHGAAAADLHCGRRRLDHHPQAARLIELARSVGAGRVTPRGDQHEGDGGGRPRRCPAPCERQHEEDARELLHSTNHMHTAPERKSSTGVSEIAG